jgi:phospholipid/cholesterol/gamma-HCH transport system substrate-binding protein
MTRMALLGVFILSALLILVAAVFLIGGQRMLFTTSYHLQAEFPTVSGLLDGAEVRLGGLRKGIVDQIQLPARPGAKVVVSMSVDSSTRTLVKRDSLAAIETEGLLGNKFVSISFGGLQAAPVNDGDTIASTPPLDLSDMLKKSNEIMDTTHSAMKNIESATAQISSMTSRINPQLAGAMVSMTGTLGDARETVVLARGGLNAFQENMQALKRSFFFRGFFKDRGYMDSSELVKWEIQTLPGSAPVKTFAFSASDLFDKPDTAKIKDRKRLNEVGAYLEKNPFGLVVVQAFTSRAGEADENMVLTQAQAMVVRDYLADKFELDDAKLKTKGMGEVTPTVPGRVHWVEICIYASDGKT